VEVSATGHTAAADAHQGAVANSPKIVPLSKAKGFRVTTAGNPLTVLPSSHVAMLSHPAEVANVIEEAAANGRRP
jgi:hypothetical protein